MQVGYLYNIYNILYIYVFFLARAQRDFDCRGLNTQKEFRIKSASGIHKVRAHVVTEIMTDHGLTLLEKFSGCLCTILSRVWESLHKSIGKCRAKGWRILFLNSPVSDLPTYMYITIYIYILIKGSLEVLTSDYTESCR